MTEPHVSKSTLLPARLCEVGSTQSSSPEFHPKFRRPRVVILSDERSEESKDLRLPVTTPRKTLSS